MYQEKKGKGKNPSEFVLMINSCAQKTGNLFQNFHGCFLVFFFFWSILKFSDECPYKSREETRKGERQGRQKQRLQWRSHQKAEEAGSVLPGSSQRECGPAHTSIWPSGLPELCEIHHTCVLNHQVCANFHGSPGNWQGISLPRNKGMKLTLKIRIRILTLFLFWTGSGSVY